MDRQCALSSAEQQVITLEWLAGFAFVSKCLALREIKKINANLPEIFNVPRFSLFQVLWQTVLWIFLCQLKALQFQFWPTLHLSAISGNYYHVSVALFQCITLTTEHCWIDVQGLRNLAGFWFRNIKSKPSSSVLFSAASMLLLVLLEKVELRNKLE